MRYYLQKIAMRAGDGERRVNYECPYIRLLLDVRFGNHLATKVWKLCLARNDPQNFARKHAKREITI